MLTIHATFGVSVKTKEPIAMFEFTTWNASFPDFFISLRHYTVIGKQLLLSNDRNRVRGAVLGLSKLDLSNDTTTNRPLFSLANTFKIKIEKINFKKGR
jgi:hypothetical protein